MPISHVSKVFAVVDAKIYKLTADPAGGSPTYGSAVDVPGIKTITIGGDVKTAELRGDNQLLDTNSVLENMTVEIEHAKLSLDVLPVILGGATADAGTTPNQTATYDRGGTDSFSYFKLSAKTPTSGADTVGGDAHVTLHKCILTGFPELGFAEEDYRTFTVGARALPLLSNNKWLTVVLNETAASLAA